MTLNTLPDTSQKLEVVIQQLNLGYNSDQDRLLLKVGLSDDSELAVWLTNRIAKNLWLLLNGEVHLPTANSIQMDIPAAQAIAKFNQEMQVAEALQKMDFATDYQPRTDVLTDGAKLATNVKLITDAPQPFTLEIICLEGLTMRMHLTQELILAMCNMLQLACKEALWDMDNHASKPMDIDTNTPKVLH